MRYVPDIRYSYSEMNPFRRLRKEKEEKEKLKNKLKYNMSFYMQRNSNKYNEDIYLE